MATIGATTYTTSVEPNEPVQRSQAQAPVSSTPETQPVMTPAEQAQVARESLTTSDQLQDGWSQVAADSEARLETTEAKPETTETRPETTEAKPETTEVKPSAPKTETTLSTRDSQLLASSGLAGAQAGYQAYRDAMPLSVIDESVMINTGEGYVSGSRATTDAERAAYLNGFVDPATGFTGQDLQHLQVSQAAQPKQAEVAAQLAATTARREEFGLGARDRELLNDPNLPSVLGRFQGATDLAGFVDPTTGITGQEILSLERSVVEEQIANNRQYGLNDRDEQVLADPNYVQAQARYQVFRDAMPKLTETRETESSSFTVEREPTEAEVKAYMAGFVDDSGLTGSELYHLQQALVEEQQGDAASLKLTRVNLGSWTGNQDVMKIPADRAFSVVGADQRAELLAGGYSMMGKAYALPDGRLIMPDEHETGVYFVSAEGVTADFLASGGVINTGNGGYNIDGLYLDGGNAAIDTTRPSGGLFGGLVNFVGNLLPGGKVGELMGDAVRDITGVLLDPAQDVMRALGDENGFAAQVTGHFEATVDVLAHAARTGNRTYDELVRRTAEFDQVDRVANQVGQALVASSIPLVAAIGAGITVVSGSMMAGHQQLAGNADADPNAGIGQAVQAYMASQFASNVGPYVSAGAANWANQVGGVAGEYSTEIGSFARTFTTNLTNQALSGNVNLTSAFESALLSVNPELNTANQMRGYLDAVRRADETGDWSQVGGMLTTLIMNQSGIGARDAQVTGETGALPTVSQPIEPITSTVEPITEPVVSIPEVEPLPSLEPAPVTEPAPEPSRPTVGNGNASFGVTNPWLAARNMFGTSGEPDAGSGQSQPEAPITNPSGLTPQQMEQVVPPAPEAPVTNRSGLTPRQMEQEVHVNGPVTPQEMERLAVSPRTSTPPPMPIGEIKTVEQLARYMDWAQREFDDLPYQDMIRVARQALYSGQGSGQNVRGDGLLDGGRRNGFPVVYELIGRLGESEPPRVRDLLSGDAPPPPISDRQRQLQLAFQGIPEIVVDDQGRSVNLGHALIPMDALRANTDAGQVVPDRLGIAFALTHGGDWFQAGAYAGWELLRGMGRMFMADDGDDLLERAGQTARNMYNAASGSASPDQLRGNQRGLEAALMARPYASPAELIRAMNQEAQIVFNAATLRRYLDNKP